MDQTGAEMIPRVAPIEVGSARPRVAWLDIGKGIAIILVVIGHALGGVIDAHMRGTWMRYAFLGIYTFHMPLFFFLSGYLVHARLSRSPDRFARSLVTSIVYPYFLWSIVQMAIITSIGGLANHPFASLKVGEIFQLLWVPASQFWFLYALFWMHLLSLLLLRRIGGVAFLLCAFAIKLVALPIGGIALVTATSLPYYALGVLAGEKGTRPPRMPPARTAILAATLAALTVAVVGARVWASTARLDPAKLVVMPTAVLQHSTGGVLAVTAALLAIVATLLAIATVVVLGTRRFAGSDWFDYLGRMTMPIFVFHIMVIAGLRIALVRLGHIHQPALLLPVLVAAGLALPILAFRVFERLHLAAALGLA